MLITDNFSGYQGIMQDTLASIRAGDDVTGGGTTINNSGDTTVGDDTDTGSDTDTGNDTVAGDMSTFRSSDERVSFDLPASWSVNDQMADQNTIAYGDSDAAVQARLASARPDLAQKTDMTGSGGLIILYPASQFGINAQNPDLSALMTQLLGQLKSQGYAVGDAEALDGVEGGLVSYIEGTEIGYVALIPFGDQIAYVTATGTLDTFPDAEDTLNSILESVQSPAAAEATAAPGLGGLGGLQGAATAEPTQASGGLGGLGGLGNSGGTSATPTQSSRGLGGLGGGTSATPTASGNG